MTGFGKATATWEYKKINVEIKSLNSKALDLSTRIAPLYREREMEIRNLISKRLKRGKVDFSLWIEKDETAAATPINTTILRNYYEQIKQVADDVEIPLPSDWFSTLLRMPDVMSHVDVQELGDEEWESVLQTINKAIDQLIDFRLQEGKALQDKFVNNVNTIGELMQNIEPYEKERIQKVRDRITEALEKSISVDYDKNRLEQELIFYIEKLDINEEKQRLANHLNYFKQTLEEEGALGKKLGFISQEMGREINTTGSKSNHAEMQNIVVRMKDELEQIKEQVLNVL
jgi:uncharacterized protein (TIGR00255 family)